MKRITPEEVLAAYKAIGLVPVEASTFRILDGARCGCAVGALINIEKPGSGYNEQWLMKKGYNINYIEGFTAGFDGISKSFFTARLKTDENMLGYNDGLLVREHIMNNISGHKMSDV